MNIENAMTARKAEEAMNIKRTKHPGDANVPRAELDPGTMYGTLSWILLSTRTPDMAIADLLVRDLDPDCDGAIDLITSDQTPIERLARAKVLFKTLRMAGETRDDRRLGGILYAGAIAAALVRFDEWISRQRRDTLRAAFAQIEADATLPPALRDVARQALAHFKEPQVRQPATTIPAPQTSHAPPSLQAPHGPQPPREPPAPPEPA